MIDVRNQDCKYCHFSCKTCSNDSPNKCTSCYLNNPLLSQIPATVYNFDGTQSSELNSEGTCSIDCALLNHLEEIGVLARLGVSNLGSCKSLEVSQTVYKKKDGIIEVFFKQKIQEINFEQLQVEIKEGDDLRDPESYTYVFTMLEYGFELDFKFKDPTNELNQATISILNTSNFKIRADGFNPVLIELLQGNFTPKGRVLLEDTTNDNFFYQEDKIEVSQIDYYDPNSLFVDITSPPVKTSAKIVSAVAVVASPFTGVMMIRLFQIFDLLNFVKIILPMNFLQFMQFFSSNLFDIMPNFIQMDEGNICNLDWKIQEQEMDCFILNNAGNIIIQLAIALVIKCIIFIIKNSQEQKKSNDGKPSFIEKMENYFNMAFFINFMIGANMDLTLGAFVNIRNFWVNPFSIFINSFISVVTILVYLRLIVIVIQKGRKMTKVLRIIKSKEKMKAVLDKKSKKKNKIVSKIDESSLGSGSGEET